MKKSTGKTVGVPTKEVILTEALSLFAVKGYEGTTIQDIASAVGIRAVSLYTHFKGKDGIFRAVFSKALTSWNEAVELAFKEAETAASLEEGLTFIIARYVSHAAATDTFRFWARVYVFPPPVLKKKDFMFMERLDADFSRHLEEFCIARGAAKYGATAPLAAALTRLTWGFLFCDSQSSPGKLDSEIRASLGLLLAGFCLKRKREQS